MKTFATQICCFPSETIKVYSMSSVSVCSFQLEIVELSMSSYQKYVLSFRKILLILEREKILGFLNFRTFPHIFLDSWKLRTYLGESGRFSRHPHV